MLLNFLAGGAAVNVLAAHAGADVRIVDAGVRADFADPRLHVAKLRSGTDSMTRGPAMSRDEAETLVARGIDFARGVTSPTPPPVNAMPPPSATWASATPPPPRRSRPSSAGAPPRVTTGRGTGVDDTAYAAKLAAVERAIAVNAPDAADGIDVLAKVGGFEIAFLAGVALGTAASGAICVLDGYPTTAAALVAAALAPASVDYMLASHQSAEPGHRVALEHLGLRPLLDLGMRLGEGSGAALAMTIARRRTPHPARDGHLRLRRRQPLRPRDPARVLTSFFDAVEFLTVARLRRSQAGDMRRVAEAQPWFPLVGLLIGALLLGFDRLASRALPSRPSTSSSSYCSPPSPARSTSTVSPMPPTASSAATTANGAWRSCATSTPAPTPSSPSPPSSR